MEATFQSDVRILSVQAEIGHIADVDVCLTVTALSQKLPPVRLELAGEGAEELKRVGGENGLVIAPHGRGDLRNRFLNVQHGDSGLGFEDLILPRLTRAALQH